MPRAPPAWAGIECFQLDKVTIGELTELVGNLRALDPRLTIIAAGGVNPENAGEYAATGVDGLAMARFAARTTGHGGLIAYAEEFLGPRRAAFIGWNFTFLYMPVVCSVLSWVVGVYACMTFNLPGTFAWQMGIGLVFLLACTAWNILCPGEALLAVHRDLPDRGHLHRLRHLLQVRQHPHRHRRQRRARRRHDASSSPTTSSSPPAATSRSASP